MNKIVKKKEAIILSQTLWLNKGTTRVLQGNGSHSNKNSIFGFTENPSLPTTITAAAAIMFLRMP